MSSKRIGNSTVLLQEDLVIRLSNEGTILLVTDKFIPSENTSYDQLIGTHINLLCEEDWEFDLVMESISVEGYWTGVVPFGDYLHTKQSRDFNITYDKLTSEYLLTQEQRDNVGTTQKLANALEQQIETLNNSAIVSETDASGRIIFVNDMFCTISGFKREELIGKTHRLLRSDRNVPGIFKEMWDTILAGKVWKGDICNQNKDGAFYWVNTTICPFFDLDGSITKFVSIRYDITKEKTQAERLLAKEAELKAKNRALIKAQHELSEKLELERKLGQLKTRFVSIVSHQFRTPLAVIQSNIDLIDMLKNPVASDKTEMFSRSRERISSQIKRLTDMMDDILMIGKVSDGKLEVNREQVHIDVLLQSVIDNFNQIDGNAKRTSLLVSGPSRMCRLDPKLLEHAFTNLISNALKYSNCEDKVDISVEYQKDFVEVKVRDYGIGIPKSEIEFMFEPFFRASNTGEVEGTGLGMVIAKEYIEANQGKINVESEVNCGTTFSMQFAQPCTRLAI